MQDQQSRVALLPCDRYDEEVIYRLLDKGIELLGGIENFVKPEEKVLLKPNLLKKSEIDKAVITHPTVMGAFARLLKEKGCRDMTMADSCGYGSTKSVIKGTGIEEALDAQGVQVIDFSCGVETPYPEGHQASSFVLAKELLDADAVFSICKMKTHALERITGAVKNSYGFVYGRHKALGHTKYPSADSFARMLIDLNTLVRPRLYIMDGIIAMEGNGPGSGEPVPMNVILMSEDPVALDTVFAELVYLKPERVPTIYHGNLLGLGTSDPARIQILSDEGEISFDQAQKRFGNPDFDVVRGAENKNFLDRVMTPFRIFKKKPRIIPENCIHCGICVEACPVETKAVDFKNGKDAPPVYDYRKCIRCFCCQEMCPQKAIEVK